MVKQDKIKICDAWNKPIHADFFDGGANLPLRMLKKSYERTNEIYLFKNNQAPIQGKSFVEVGCATGELYRYLNAYYPRFKYYGFDISKAAINRAKKKYPRGNFFICNKDLSDIYDYCQTPAVLFARDVVLHQLEPFNFLMKLISSPKEAVILRIRTRDRGESVLDPELSCQWHYQEWVPYMILNIDEVIDKIRKEVAFTSILVLKNYQQLGGWNNRFLPKDCYYSETGTAETSIFIKLADKKIPNPFIAIQSKSDTYDFNIFEKIMISVYKKFG